MPKRAFKSSGDSPVLLRVFRAKAVWVALGIFGFYLLTLPQIVARIVPCLNSLPGTSYTWANCHVTLALDWYIGLALVGLFVVSLTVFISLDQPKLIPTAVLTLVLTITTVLAYYIYIPTAEAQVRRAPIQLEEMTNSR